MFIHAACTIALCAVVLNDDQFLTNFKSSFKIEYKINTLNIFNYFFILKIFEIRMNLLVVGWLDW